MIDLEQEQHQTKKKKITESCTVKEFLVNIQLPKKSMADLANRYQHRLDNVVGLTVSPQTMKWPPCNNGGPAEKISLDRYAPSDTESWGARLKQFTLTEGLGSQLK